MTVHTFAAEPEECTGCLKLDGDPRSCKRCSRCGRMIRPLKTADECLGPAPPLSTQEIRKRLEPILKLYEQRKITHVPRKS